MSDLLYKFVSEKKNNPLAPEWKYYMWESIDKDIDYDFLKEFILDKEKEILSKPVSQYDGKFTDGHTGLGKDSLTSRFQNYNFLKFENKEIDKIKKLIIDTHEKFLKALELDIKSKFYVQCWVNVMRKGEQIKPHLHDVSPNSYLGGHLCVQCDNTSTHYICPQNQLNNPEVLSSKNETGKITLFQNCIPHYTDVHNSDNERITIAFDIDLVKNNNNVILYER